MGLRSVLRRQRAFRSRGYQLWQPLLLLAVVTAGLSIWSYSAQQRSDMYTLSGPELQLVGKSSVDQKLIKMVDGNVTYNRAEESATQDHKSLTMAAPVDATGEAPYAAELNPDHSRGLTFADAAGELEFSLLPQFQAATATYLDGRMIYPEGPDRTHVYTFKDNGLKEDIILTKPSGDRAQYSWKLQLGDKLEARMRPDGSVGLFSANPLLFGDVKTSDDASRQLVDTARVNGAKEHLAFVLPAPYIKDADGNINSDDVSFNLKNNILTLEAENLAGKTYPLTIDPSVVVTTTADFRTANDFGMIDYATANQIGRSAISLGTVGAATQQLGAITNNRHRHTSVAYNGYLYLIGGNGGGFNDDIMRCPINAGGSIGACTDQTNIFTNARNLHASVVYNGYIYIIGGNSGATRYDDIQYCNILSNGSIGSCTQQTSAFTTARNNLSAVAHNGYLYIMAGSDGSTLYNDIQYCPINANGSVGTCVQQSNAFTTARQNTAAEVHNGYIYIIGGNAAGLQNDIQYCPINANGSVGTCVQQTAAFTTARASHGTVISNGYLYIIGGQDGVNPLSDVQRCPINANGSVGTCVQQAAAFTARHSFPAVVYDGYIYITGGNDGTNPVDDLQYLPINAGSPSGFGSVGSTTQQAAAFTNIRNNHSSVVYNNYLYIIGGWNGTNYYDDINRCPINADGSVGTCIQQTTAFATARYGHSSVVYQGYLYIIGGTSGTNQSDVQYCPISQTDGSVGTCVSQTGRFTTARQDHSSSVYNGYLYIVGGNGGGAQSDVHYCEINTDGSIDVCTQQTGRFTNARYGHTSEAYNGYLYIVGGWNGTTYYDDIQYCVINAGGSINVCTVQAAAFTTARYGHTTGAYNGFLYIAGGTSGSQQNDVQYCALTSGAVGACTVQAGAFTTARNSHTSIVNNGFLYVVGGTSGTNQNDVQRLRTNSPPLMGRYEETFDIGRLAYSVNDFVYNGAAKCGATLIYATAGTNGIFGSNTTVIDALPGSTHTISVTNKRYVRMAITLNDSVCGGTSTVTDMTLSYTIKASPPTLNTPAAGALSISTLPALTLRAPDPENNYLRYKIEVCSNADCSSILRTIDQTSSQTGWSGQDQQTSTAYTGNAAIASSTMATHTYQATALSTGTQYWWRGYAIDPSDTNTWSDASSIQSFITTGPAATPTIVSPVANSTGVNTQTEFLLRTSEPDSDYVRYKIEVCTVADCSVILRTIDQTSSQTGWTSQNASSGTAYTAVFDQANSQLAVHTYQATLLVPNTQYWWRAYAIDPAGTNTWSAATSISTFTTGVNLVRIIGGTTILGGTKLGN